MTRLADDILLSTNAHESGRVSPKFADPTGAARHGTDTINNAAPWSLHRPIFYLSPQTELPFFHSNNGKLFHNDYSFPHSYLRMLYDSTVDILLLYASYVHTYRVSWMQDKGTGRRTGRKETSTSPRNNIWKYSNNVRQKLNNADTLPLTS